MEGKVIKIYDNCNPKNGTAVVDDDKYYTVYNLPDEVGVNDIIEFQIRISQANKPYGVFQRIVNKNYFDAYGTQKEKEAIDMWLQTLGKEKGEVLVEEDHDVGHDYVIFHEDGTETLIEVKNEERYWYDITGNVTVDAISAFDIVDEEVSTMIENNNYWISVDNYNTFIEGINIRRRGSLYESDADVMVKRILDTDFVVGYKMQKLREDAEEFEKEYNLRVNKKSDYNIDEEWESATYCVKPAELEKYKIKDFSEIPKRKRKK